MERITAGGGNEKAGNSPKCFKEPCGTSGCQADVCGRLDTVCGRLTEYENTGLCPDEVKELANRCAALEAVINRIAELAQRYGGCDAKDEEAKGWDSACGAIFGECERGWEEHIIGRFGRVR